MFQLVQLFKQHLELVFLFQTPKNQLGFSQHVAKRIATIISKLLKCPGGMAKQHHDPTDEKTLECFIAIKGAGLVGYLVICRNLWVTSTKKQNKDSQHERYIYSVTEQQQQVIHGANISAIQQMSIVKQLSISPQSL